MNELPTSRWIGADKADSGAPLFRREFMVSQPVVSATLSICGLGYHEAWMNGERVGDHVLDPAQTDYECRVFYVTHDVAGLIRPGANALGVMLGNGWYNQDRVWTRQARSCDSEASKPAVPSIVTGLSYGTPRLMAELRLTYDDGAVIFVRCDEAWRWSPGPVVDNNIYAGECYDARREIDGWHQPEFDGAAWRPVVFCSAPEGELQEQVMPPIRRIETRRPLRIQARDGRRYVVDMGQNFAGWARITITAPPGTEITMRFAEALLPDGNIDTASTGVFATQVEQVDRYICKGVGEETWEPRFTYHGFRYVEVSGWPDELTEDGIAGVVVHTDLPIAGEFKCSDTRLNNLHSMALWTLRSNIHGIPEDCPARERCGWLGDANLIAEFSMWNYRAKSFWEKYLGDIETTRLRNGGIPCNIAPGKRGTEHNANPDWAAAFIMLPWYVYLHYGDEAVLARHWQGMEQLMSHFADESTGWILRGGYGDFFDPGSEAIVMHTPPTLSTTFWFHRCAGVMTAAAIALGKPDAAARYREWSHSIAAAVVQCYFDHERGSFGSQGANVLALAFEILPDKEDQILRALVEDIRERDVHINVGVMGVRYLFEVLTRHGHGSLALALMQQNSYPGFGHLIERGATTLWECWGEAGHNETHGARSLNHPFMGGFDNCFFNTLAGLRINPEYPGFARFFVEPHLIPGITWVRCCHDCVRGRITSNWQRRGDKLEWEITVPQGTRAAVKLPLSREMVELPPGQHTGVES